MIKYLPLPKHIRYGNPWDSPAHKSIDAFCAMWTTSGTWIAVSPFETIPEEYLRKIGERKDFRVLYDIPDDWKLIELSCEDTGHNDLVYKAKNDIYSVPGHRIIKEMTVSDGYLWAVASGDLNYPMCHDRLVLDEFPWIETSDWKLICIGTSFDLDMTRKVFKESIDPDIIYEYLF